VKKVATRALLWILSLLAKATLEQYRPRIVAITGSVGKTTAKEMTAWVLSSNFRVGKNPDNANTEWGVVATIINPDFTPTIVDDGRAKITARQALELIGTGFKNMVFQTISYPQVLVLELAADRPGDITWFNRLMRYDVVVVTNVGQVHLEFYDDQAHLRNEKLSLIKGLRKDGLLIINENLRRYIPTGGSFRQQTFAEPAYDFENGQARYSFTTDAGEVRISNRHTRAMALSAPIAAQIALELGINLTAISNKISNFKSLRGRFNVDRLKRGIILINDAYNANPDSVRVALLGLQDIAKGVDELSSAKPRRRRVAILGGMRELGEAYEQAHHEIGRFASDKADLFILIGEEGRLMADTIVGNAAKVIQTENITADEILKHLRDNDIVLIKASKAIGLDKLAEDLKNKLS